eukprot:COSAG03_NODE_14373_length_466_cov_1.858311_1_plen_103_part_01
MDEAALDSEKPAAVEQHETAQDLRCEMMVSCANTQSVRAFRAKVPEPFRFCCSSFIGCVAMAALNALALLLQPAAWKPTPAGTIPWAFSYGLSLWAQHWLHST